MLKTIESPIQTPIPSSVPSSTNTKKYCSQESVQQIEEQDEQPGFFDYLIGLTLPRMQIPSSSKPSVPSASLPPSSPSISPPASDIELTQQQIRERSRSRDSSIDKRSSKK